MSVYGIRPSIPAPTPSHATGVGGATTRAPQSRVDQPRIGHQPAGAPSAPNATAPATAPGTALPVQPPPGTDPELWSVLSADERAYFAKVGAMGPLTYGRMMTNPIAAPIARGGRLDVKA